MTSCTTSVELRQCPRINEISLYRTVTAEENLHLSHNFTPKKKPLKFYEPTNS